MFYVYILKSQKDKSYYVGTTEDLNKRIDDHNRGTATYSSSKVPFVLVWSCNLDDKKKALDFEKYLKSGSGFAFRNKHLI